MQDYFENDIYGETERILLRHFNDNDRENYLNLSEEISQYPSIYESKQVCDMEFERVRYCTDGIYIALEEKSSKDYVGELSIRYWSDELREIGISITKEYRRMGIATEVIGFMLNKEKTSHGEDKFLIRINNTNIASLGLFHKLEAQKFFEEPNERERMRELLKEYSNNEDEIEDSINRIFGIDGGKEAVIQFYLYT